MCLRNLQETLDTVDHDSLIQKLYHHGIKGAANNCFLSYLQKWLQSLSVNDFNSNFEHVRCGVPQGFILGLLLF